MSRDGTSSNIMMNRALSRPLPHHTARSQARLQRECPPVQDSHSTSGKIFYHRLGRYKSEERPPLELTIRGGDRTVPEIYLRRLRPVPDRRLLPREPHPARLFRGWEITSQKFGFEFMLPLGLDMVQTDPSQRPNMDEVVQQLDILECWRLRTRVVKKAIYWCKPDFIISFRTGSVVSS
ncbi:hypothetical protein B0H14DRAFT_2735218 [Mycena olivaceomarginata]|nr:hypothetical protein B0H14DRAFT_2735218 [Mycena olivaceomarginata]